MIDYQTQIDEIMENFNWDRVHRAMQALNWKWCIYNGKDPGVNKIPDISDLMDTAKYLLNQVAKEPVGYALLTGGLEAEKIGDKQPGYLKLTFVLATWDCLND